LLKWWNNLRVKEEDKENGKIKNQWTEDYKLLGWSPRGLCPEYLEMGEFPVLFSFYIGFFFSYGEVQFSLKKLYEMEGKERYHIEV
jgi:hypothetical protein